MCENVSVLTKKYVISLTRQQKVISLAFGFTTRQLLHVDGLITEVNSRHKYGWWFIGDLKRNYMLMTKGNQLRLKWYTHSSNATTLWRLVHISVSCAENHTEEAVFRWLWAANWTREVCLKCEEHKPLARVIFCHARGSNVALGLIGMFSFSNNQRPSKEKGWNKKKRWRNMKMKWKFSILKVLKALKKLSSDWSRHRYGYHYRGYQWQAEKQIFT